MAEGTLFGPGSTSRIDRHGRTYDGLMSLEERFTSLGLSWRIDTGYVTLASLGDYASISFKTPATGRCRYTLAGVDKSGGEVVVSLVEGGTVTGGTAFSPYNLDWDVGTTGSPFTDVKTGVVLSGGTERFPSLVPGTANPSTKPGGSLGEVAALHLSNGKVYTLKFLAKAAVTMAAHVVIGYDPLET